MEFRKIECFLAVVDHGGIARAAAALHLAQPSLSQSIKSLEDELGAELFHRTGRGLALTPVGTELVEPARKLLRDVATARSSVAEIAGLRVGHVDIAAMPGAFEHLFGGLVTAFRARYPEVTMRIREATSEPQLMRSVRDGHVELAFGFVPSSGTPPVAHLDMGELEVTALGTDEMCLAVPAPFGTQVPDPVSPADLPDLPVIAVSHGAVARQTVEAALRASGVRTELAVVTDHRQLELPLVAAGVGMAWMSRNSVHGADTRRVALRSMDPPVVLRYGVFRRPGHLAPAAKAFVELAVETGVG